MKIEFETQTKTVCFIRFNGIKFYRDGKGYWLGTDPETKKPIRLHRYVWQFFMGDIPDGYEVHHIDMNPDNNDILNLALLSEEQHKEIHKKLISDERKAFMIKNFNDNARPAACEWHGSAKGKEWHKEHFQTHTKDIWFEKVTKKCKCCGKEYTVQHSCAYKSLFCSNKCKAQYRRDSGIDNIEKQCPICGRCFSTNKYSQAKYCSKDCQSKRNSKSRNDNVSGI